MVPSFAFDGVAALEWLPSYFDTATIATDILRANRGQNGTAAGTNEKVSTSGFFGQDVFSNPLDLDLAKQCGIDPFSNVLFKELDLWYPKINKGYFYSNEREFYLYAKKRSKTLGQIAVTSFYLPAPIVHNKPVIVRVAGEKVDDTHYDLVKDRLILYHKDLSIGSGEEEIEITGSIANWNGDSFIFSTVMYRLKINEGETQYLLPDDYINSGPVVVTDDLSYPTDSDVISNREFGVGFDEYHSRSEIILSNKSNMIPNGQFDYVTDDAPSFWDSDKCQIIGAEEPHFNIAGTRLASLEDQGFIQTTLPVTTGDQYNLSFHARSAGSGDISWEIEFFNQTHQALGVVVTGSAPAKSNWQRYAIGFGASGVDFDITTPQEPVPCEWLTGYEPPSRSYVMTVKIKHNYSPSFTGTLELDAVQYENEPNPTLYHRKPFFHEMTVEYETSSDEYFIDSSLSMSPVTNLMTDGFLYIPEIPAAHYGGPYTPTVTTLHEWRWPEGRAKVMPWARTKGKDKLRKRPVNYFNHIPDPKPEVIAPISNYSTAGEINLIPSVPSTFVGDKNGIGFTIRVKDTDNNPFAIASVHATISDYNLRYPGTLSKKLYGLKEKLGTSVLTVTDNAGVVPLTWIPPDQNAGVYRGDIPAPTLTSTAGDKISVIHTEYPVSLESYGNVTILDNQGRQIPTHAETQRVEIHEPALGPDTSQVRLKYPAKVGSISVVVEGTKYIENQINILSTNQFYVDYDNSLITVKGRATNIYVEYIPSYVFVSQVDPYKIMLYKDKIFPNYSDNIVLGYDFSVKLNVSVDDPGALGVVEREFLLIAQNSLNQKTNTYNEISLEF